MELIPGVHIVHFHCCVLVLPLYVGSSAESLRDFLSSPLQIMTELSSALQTFRESRFLPSESLSPFTAMMSFKNDL